MSRVPVICVDGPSGAGKGTLSLQLARSLDWHLLDSGALYRVIGHACWSQGIDWQDEAAVVRMTRGLDVRFEPVGDAAFSAIGRRSSEAKVQAQQDEDVPHPARLYIDLLPGEATDDPLLAVCASAMLGVVDEACRENEGVATLSQIFEGMLNLGVSPDEVDEALDHLLTTELLLEIDDDVFVPCTG